MDAVLGELQGEVEAVVAAERAHPGSPSPIERATVGVLYALLVESREINRLTRWLVVATIAVLSEAIAEFLLVYVLLH